MYCLMKDQDLKQSLNEENFKLFPEENVEKKEVEPDVSPLKSLIGAASEEEFFSNIWEKKCKTVNKSFDTSRLFQMEQLGQMLSVPQPDITSNITMGKIIDGEYDGVVVSLADGNADMYEIYRLWAQGYSLIVPALHVRWQPIAEFTKKLSEQIGFKVEANLYYTPPNAVAFPAHYDTHDIFIVQIFGEKLWHLYKSRHKLPLKSQRYDVDDPVLQKDLQAKKRNVTLKQGEVMYLPRGHVHSAEATDVVSMHLSIGIYPIRWLDILDEFLSRHGADSAFLRGAVTQECLKNGIDKEMIAKITGAIADKPKDWQKIIDEKRR